MTFAETGGETPRALADGRGAALGPVALATALAALTGMIVLLGVTLAAGFFRAPASAPAADRPDGPILLSPSRAFAGAVAGLTGLGPDPASTVASNLAFWAAMALVAARPEPAGSPPGVSRHAVLCMGLLPVTFFCRIPGPDATLVLIAAATFLGLDRGWPPLGLALLVGLGSAEGLAGLALAAPLLWRVATVPSVTPRRAVAMVGALAPVASWGLAATLLSGGDPPWSRPASSAVASPEPAASILGLEPLWGAFDRHSPYYWRSVEPVAVGPLTSLAFQGPAWFLACAGLVLWGRSRGGLTAEEFAGAVALLAVAYTEAALLPKPSTLIRSCALVVPAYSVAGRLLATKIGPAAACAAGLGGFWLGILAGSWVVGTSGP